MSPPGFDALYGMEDLQTDGDAVRARADRRPAPAAVRIVHGGVYAALAESVASMGTLEGTGRGEVRRRPLQRRELPAPGLKAGHTLTAVAVARHRGRTTWVWEVDVRDQHDRSCALVRVTIAVRELPSPG